MVYYFAYGSNMDLTQMDSRCPRNYERLEEKAVLEGWEFIINERGVANIRRKENSEVYGLLFKITVRCRNCLDMHENYPKTYDRPKLTIKFRGRDKKTLVYIDKKHTQRGKPRIGYLEKIVRAAGKFKFPKDYIEHLKSFTNLENLKLRR